MPFKFKIQNLKIKILVFVCTFNFYLLTFTFPVHAQTQPFPPTSPPIPCNSSTKTNPEFNSLRPYQADPCSTETAAYAKFCGNNLTFHTTITENYPGNGNCSEAEGKIICQYSEAPTVPITINLSGANLPFMGNTEDVKNSQSASDSLDETQKVNGYVSWYLQGVPNKAEYGSENTSEKDIVNFSGPINKLLPRAYLDAQRTQSINNVSKGTNHNQIIVCANQERGGLVGSILNIFNLGTYTPTACYNGNGAPAQADKVLTLSDWNGSIGFNVISNAIVRAWLTGVKLIYPAFADLIEKSLGNHWALAKPPLPWDNGDGKPFVTEVEYRKAYAEWRGNACAIIPVYNLLICVNNIFAPNLYADLFPYIPLASTEDLKGGIKIDSVSSATSPSAQGVTVKNVAFSNQIPSTLFYPHMQETNELASTLQDTFVAQSEQNNKTGSATNSTTTTSCSDVEVRSNKGDNFFATQLTGDLTFTANFSCTFNPITTPKDTCFQDCLNQGKAPSECGSYCSGPHPTPTPQPPQSCERDVYIRLSTTASSPKVDDVWSQLVAGPQSIFKRIFPKTNTEGSVGQITDMPGSTNITYSGAGISQSNADLKIPHIGGIAEYFLKGIQTALRPKGYGEPISFSPNSNVAACSTTGGNASLKLPTASGSCQLQSTGARSVPGVGSIPGIPPTMKAVLEAAAETYKVPPSLLLAVMFGEGDFNPGRWDWTEANVASWSAGCANMPSCSPGTFPSTGIIPFFSSVWDGYGDAVKAVDPNREPNPCNFMDATFALAKMLQQGQNGIGYFTSCFGIDLNKGGGGSASCSWDQRDIETAIKVYENGYQTECYSKTQGCVLGGANALCPAGDTCEKYSQCFGGGGNCSSHPYCLWTVYSQK